MKTPAMIDGTPASTGAEANELSEPSRREYSARNSAADAHRNGDQCNDGRHHQRPTIALAMPPSSRPGVVELRQQGQLICCPLRDIAQHKDQGQNSNRSKRGCQKRERPAADVSALKGL